MAEDPVEDIDFPLGPVSGPLAGLYAFGAIFLAGFLGEGYWVSVLLETAVGVMVYVLVGLALSLNWHRSKHYRWFIVGGVTGAVGLVVAGGFANTSYWQELSISLGVGLALATVLEFSLNAITLDEVLLLWQLRELLGQPNFNEPEDLPPPKRKVYYHTLIHRRFVGGHWNGKEDVITLSGYARTPSAELLKEEEATLVGLCQVCL